MPQQAAAATARHGVRALAAPDAAVRFAAALPALAVAAMHVADQGAVTVLGIPTWIG